MKKTSKNFWQFKNNSYLCIVNQERLTRTNKIGSLAQLNRASDYGSEGYRFESYANHKKAKLKSI